MIQKDQKGMTLIVKAVTSYIVGIILLFGIYMTVHGHLFSGGGVAGGIIIAMAFINYLLAFGRELSLFRMYEICAKMLSVGALLFIGIGLFGLKKGYLFFNFLNTSESLNANFVKLFGAGTIPLLNIAITFSISASIFMIFLALIISTKK